jgi:hypothetical protein
MIAKIDELRKAFGEHPTKETGLMCCYCFDAISKTLLNGGYIGLWCSCYARIFEPGNPRAATVTERIWQGFIDKSHRNNSRDWSLLGTLDDGAMDCPIINSAAHENYDCWCPGCARDRKLGGKVVWALPQGVHVTTYGVCPKCFRLSETTAGIDRSLLINRIEARLVGRYPILRSRLPDFP